MESGGDGMTEENKKKSTDEEILGVIKDQEK